MRHPRVLIADDDPVLLLVLRQCLRHAGYDVEQAGNGEEAAAMAAQHAYDAIILDVRMPGMDGFEAAQAIREELPRHDVPIILMSAHPDGTTLDEGLSAGADDFVQKPFLGADITERIEELRDHSTDGTQQADLDAREIHAAHTGTGVRYPADDVEVEATAAEAVMRGETAAAAMTPYQPRHVGAAGIHRTRARGKITPT